MTTPEEKLRNKAEQVAQYGKNTKEALQKDEQQPKDKELTEQFKDQFNEAKAKTVGKSENEKTLGDKLKDAKNAVFGKSESDKTLVDKANEKIE